MISIKRPPTPDFLKQPGNKWEVETQEAIGHYSAPFTKQFEFKHYSDPLMKAELKSVFGKKCAYCEAIYAHVYDGDIEHFRPKGKVKERTPQTPGYYWLANDWNNLLLSCQHCNQSRKHEREGSTTAKSAGKLDQFPLSDTSKYVQKHDSGNGIADEEPFRLLLNPCVDNPEKHFAYNMTNAVMEALTEQAKASLDVYVLWRPELVSLRREKLTLLLRQIARVKRELERYNHDKTPEQKMALQQELDDLLEYTGSDKEYAGMARFFVRSFMKENNLTPTII